ncbi:MAG: ATP-dependent DNA helicase RecG [Candidatus Vogelbacteria bacterium RIFOXYD1_FULL_44_32]|uniref:Probable DNA 3'-5' helicase RecG n=1 Tax=Candidatus Vogelbacteria bacterium RIFOXYD1_FULL_44_32 TaxID=1802438 RepID=A0A1G2QEB8_9BACT|nr:MAG: ATP-dependent DNA helicase RecG [Candidatus Vogelbacteria bacterium RIFOXYD1_FULL_44_32]
MNPTDLIPAHFRLKPDQKVALEKLGLKTLQDLLLYLPNRYAFQGEIKNIADIVVGENVALVVRVIKAETKKAYRQKIPMAEATFEDATGKIKAVWFYQAYLAKKLFPGQTVQLSGKVTERKGEVYLANPDINTDPVPNFSKNTIFASGDGTNVLVPVYPETKGLSSGWFYYHIQKLLASGLHKEITDPIPTEILKKYHLPKLDTALVWVHGPQNERDSISARKRFAFEEVFFIQLDRLQARSEYKKARAHKVSVTAKDLTQFTVRFPFPLTRAQNSSIGQIMTDLQKPEPMTRLLEGDVGSGKTAVAACAAFACVQAGLEVAYMVPTEILARQHFESFIENFAHLNINIGLMTGSECRKFPSKINPREHTHISRPQLLKWVASGDIPIVIGTHSLIQKSVVFKKLGLAIIDEQHRFGVMQRKKILKEKDSTGTVPHLLSMTATPIPRTLALAIFGDLDLSVLDELPKGRKPIITKIIAPDKRDTAYEAIRQELKAGRQAYVICPRIDEPDPDKEMALLAKSAVAESKRLAEKVFPEYKVGLVHSKLKPADKEKVMADFTSGKIQILVATSVIEVGVNVPNATLIVIEGAERFGLAQLHQLRGRVQRSSHQSYCYIFSDTKNATSMKRLKALEEAKSGFELAEMDLALRGSGALAGTKQWGVTDVGMEAIKNIKMVEAAREEAKKILETDVGLKKHPELKSRLHDRQEVHFE